MHGCLSVCVRDEHIILSKLPNIQFLNSCFFPHYSPLFSVKLTGGLM